MKMSQLIWGSLIILIGLSIIFHLPFFRIAIGLLLIYWGISFIFGGFSWRYSGNTAIFCEQKVNAAIIKNEYNTAFGNSVVDLTGIDPVNNKKIRFNTLFGHSELKVNPEVPMKISVNAAFAGANLPDGTVITFGKYEYKTPAYSPTANAVNIEASVVFGGLDIVN